MTSGIGPTIGLPTTTQGEAFLKKYDKNGAADGKIDHTELTSIITEFDANKDGKLDDGETAKLAKKSGDVNIAKTAQAYAGEAVHPLLTLRIESHKTVQDAKSITAYTGGKAWDSTKTFEIINTAPSKQPLVLETTDKSVNMQTQDGVGPMGDPVDVQYKDSEGKVQSGKMYTFTTGDQYIVPADTKVSVAIGGAQPSGNGAKAVKAYVNEMALARYQTTGKFPHPEKGIEGAKYSQYRGSGSDMSLSFKGMDITIHNSTNRGGVWIGGPGSNINDNADPGVAFSKTDATDLANALQQAKDQGQIEGLPAYSTNIDSLIAALREYASKAP